MTPNRGIRVARYLCLFSGVFLIVSGLMILLLPNSAGALFDIEDIEKLKEPVALAMGIRQIAIGLMIAVLVLTNQIKALGFIMLIGGLVPLFDFLVFSPSIGWMSSLRHGATVPLILGLGIYLLYKTRRTDMSQ